MQPQKPRACETEIVESLHGDFAPVGTLRHVTPEEAKLLVTIGRARRPGGMPAGMYANREMRTTGGRRK